MKVVPFNPSKQPWKPGDGAHVPFSHIVVNDEGKIHGTVIAGSAYTVGTLQECRLWQLASGMRAKTQIIPF